MNRSILIVICDFLLVTMLAFSNFENVNTPPEKGAPPTAPNSLTRESGIQNDLAGALKMALEDERKRRDQLANELARSRQATENQADRIREYDESLRSTRTQAQQLAQERSMLELQISAAQTNLQSMQGALSATSSEAQLARQQLERLQAELRRRDEDAAKLRDKLTDLEKSQQAAANEKLNLTVEKQQLHTQLQVAETERRLVGEQLTVMRTEVQAVRAEKAQLQASTARLADGVNALAEKSLEISQEIKENRPHTPNAIFSEYSRNRVQTRFDAVRSGAFGADVQKEKSAQSLVITDGTNHFVLFHLSDTPLSFWPGNEWRSLTGVIGRNMASVPITRLAFWAVDPRVVVVSLDAGQAQQLGAKIYRVAPDPYKFEEAVLLGANENYYGECRFQIDPELPNYVRMDRALFGSILGKFNPSRGDFVLSKTGELLGIMVNSEYCGVLNPLTAGATIECGPNLRPQQVGQVFSQLQNRMTTLPVRLQ